MVNINGGKPHNQKFWGSSISNIVKVPRLKNATKGEHVLEGRKGFLERNWL